MIDYARFARAIKFEGDLSENRYVVLAYNTVPSNIMPQTYQSRFKNRFMNSQIIIEESLCVFVGGRFVENNEDIRIYRKCRLKSAFSCYSSTRRLPFEGMEGSDTGRGHGSKWIMGRSHKAHTK